MAEKSIHHPRDVVAALRFRLILIEVENCNCPDCQRDRAETLAELAKHQTPPQPELRLFA